MREQEAGWLIGLNVQAGDPLAQERLQARAATVTSQPPGTEAVRARGLLAGAVRTQVSV